MLDAVHLQHDLQKHCNYFEIKKLEAYGWMDGHPDALTDGWNAYFLQMVVVVLGFYVSPTAKVIRDGTSV